MRNALPVTLSRVAQMLRLQRDLRLPAAIKCIFGAEHAIL